MKSFFSMLVAACAASVIAQNYDPTAAAATVNGEKITNNEYFGRMSYLDNVGFVEEGRFVEMIPAFMTLRRLIDERLLLLVAKDKGVLPSQSEVDAEIARRRTDSADQYTKMKNLGVPDNVITGRMLVEMAQFRLLTQGIVITDEQVQSHYNLNKMIYRKPATVKLRVIVVEDAASKAKVDEALKTKAFAVVAKELSTDLTKFDGGDLPRINMSSLPQNVSNEVSRLKAGDKTNWIESGTSFLKYLIEQKEDETQLPLDEKLKTEIKKKMMMVAGQQKNSDAVGAALAQKRAVCKVTIPAPGLQKLWDYYVAESTKGKTNKP
jgi:parvulin-like peptidyl-prolyl isomerase